MIDEVDLSKLDRHNLSFFSGKTIEWKNIRILKLDNLLIERIGNSLAWV